MGHFNTVLNQYQIKVTYILRLGNCHKYDGDPLDIILNTYNMTVRNPNRDMRPKTKDPVKVTLSLDRPIKELGQSLARYHKKSLTVLVEELIMAEARASSHSEVELLALQPMGAVPGQKEARAPIDVAVADLPNAYLSTLVCVEALESSFYPCSFPFKKGQHLLAVSMDPRPRDVVLAQSQENITVAEVSNSGTFEPVFKKGSVDGYDATHVVVSVV